MSEKTLGQIGYEAYAAAQPAGLSSISGAELPTWDGQSPGIQRRWEAGGEAVRQAVLDRMQEGDSP